MAALLVNSGASDMLPNPLSTNQVFQFEQDGFLVIRKVLSPPEITKLLVAGDKIVESQKKSCVTTSQVQKRDLDIRSGLLYNHSFYELVRHNIILPSMVQLMSCNIHLHDTALIYKFPKPLSDQNFRRGWHRDMRMPRDFFGEALPRVGVKACYCLTNFDTSAGMTLMARASHRSPSPLLISEGCVDPQGYDVCELSLLAGDVLLFDNRIFHTAISNTSLETSKRIIYGYSYRWLRPEIYLENMRFYEEDSFREDNPIMNQVLGFDKSIDICPSPLQKWQQENGIPAEKSSWTKKV